jgi:hypothetical protein
MLSFVPGKNPQLSGPNSWFARAGLRHRQANSGAIRGRADEFDAGGFQGSLNLEQGRGAAGRDILNELKTLDCSQSNARPCGKLFC